MDVSAISYTFFWLFGYVSGCLTVLLVLRRTNPDAIRQHNPPPAPVPTPQQVHLIPTNQLPIKHLQFKQRDIQIDITQNDIDIPQGDAIAGDAIAGEEMFYN